VICSTQASARFGNQPSVARLPRCQTSTKAELLTQKGGKEVPLVAKTAGGSYG
jgi:hypothetical protein